MYASVLAQFSENDRRIFWMTVGILCTAVLCYLGFLGLTVAAVVERKEAKHDLETTSARITALESSYVALVGRVDLTLAHGKGFIDVLAPKYLSAAGDEHTILTMRQ